MASKNEVQVVTLKFSNGETVAMSVPAFCDMDEVNRGDLLITKVGISERTKLPEGCEWANLSED